jgi:hypothetical protein
MDIDVTDVHVLAIGTRSRRPHTAFPPRPVCLPAYPRSIPEWGEGVKLIYRHYATLYFVFAVDQQESDLGILDLIQGELLTKSVRRV